MEYATAVLEPDLAKGGSALPFDRIVAQSQRGRALAALEKASSVSARYKILLCSTTMLYYEYLAMLYYYALALLRVPSY